MKIDSIFSILDVIFIRLLSNLYGYQFRNNPAVRISITGSKITSILVLYYLREYTFQKSGK